MFKTLKNAWRQPELKNKLLFTLLIIILYRLGSAIPVPYFDITNYEATLNAFGGGSILEFMNMLSGGALAQGTLFALGVSPYITASIVIQLLSVAIPKLGEKAKEGEEGKRFINMLTRIVTIVLAVITAIGYAFLLNNYELIVFTGDSKWATFFTYAVIVTCYCAGAAIVMWLAEKINESGIGNGISIILFANIIASFPTQISQLWNTAFEADLGNGVTGFSGKGLAISLTVVVGLVAMLLLIVWMSDGERRIPIQYAKRVVGRKMYGGQSTNLPIKVNMSGVMPIIFASSIVTIPATIRSMFFASSTNWFTKIIDGTWTERWTTRKLDYLVGFNQNSIPYLLIFFVLLIAFAYFYVAISFDPTEVANNIKNNGGAILGIRPGRPTVDYIKKILGRVTLLGALLVAVIACVPMVANIAMVAFDISSISALAFGGSSMMIVVGVAIETIRELEAQLSLRNYKGFLD